MLSKWIQNDLKVDGACIHYARTGAGSGKPALVLVHGFSDNGLCWADTAQDLEDNYDVIMPDMRGHGLSERVQPGSKTDMTTIKDFLRELA
jgi:pimeloyl-ACP methyl ester carboxylesterase